MTVFHLLRHGERASGRVLVGRMPGIGLTDRGRAEIAAMAERLAGDNIAAIYSSPLQRTRESAEIVAERLDLPIAFRDELLELDFGAAPLGQPDARHPADQHPAAGPLAVPQQVKDRHAASGFPPARRRRARTRRRAAPPSDRRTAGSGSG